MNQIIRPEEVLAEYYPPLTDHEAAVEANRCLYCYDAPCTHACPTHIDIPIPRFIKKIATENVVMGATCARVCPLRELCEGACVLNAEDKPIMIGRLQRYATDYVYRRGIDVFKPGPPPARRSASSGLSCAGELAKLAVFERREPLEANLPFEQIRQGYDVLFLSMGLWL